MGLEKVRKYSNTEETEIIFVERCIQSSVSKYFLLSFSGTVADNFKFQNVQSAGGIGCRNRKGRCLCGRFKTGGKKESEISDAGTGVSVRSDLFPSACSG